MPRQFKRLSHSVYECKYHIVFCPKYRYKILRDEMAEYMRQQIYQLCRQKDGVEVLELQVQTDHVHLVASVPPKYAISNLMGFLKGKLATRMFARYERLRRQYWGQHFWSRGYCVSTIGLDEDQIRKYVKWQAKREKRMEANQDRLFD